MSWNLLVQPDVRKFQKGLGSQRLRLLGNSSDSSARQDLLRRLQKSPPQTSGSSQHTYTRESDIGSSIGVMEGILLHARPLFNS